MIIIKKILRHENDKKKNRQTSSCIKIDIMKVREKSFQLNEVIKYIAWLVLPQITLHIYVKKKLIQCGYIYACILCSFGGLIPVANGKKSHEFFKGKIFTPGVIICTSLSE